MDWSHGRQQYLVIRIDGRSMEPVLLNGEEVLLELTQDVQPGDIVWFKQGQTFFLHRCLEVAGEGYILEKGDANYMGTRISKESILGRVLWIRRHGVWFQPSSRYWEKYTKAHRNMMKFAQKIGYVPGQRLSFMRRGVLRFVKIVLGVWARILMAREHYFKDIPQTTDVKPLPKEFVL